MSHYALEPSAHGENSTECAPSRTNRKEPTTRKLRPGKRRTNRRLGVSYCAVATLAILPSTIAQNCISLSGSSECRAFSGASVSTDSTLTGLFPFLSTVTDTASFDSQLRQYINNGFAQQRYQNLIGCSAFDLTNSSDYYARYTTSVLCNAIVQNSISPCDLSGDATRPLCANTCVRISRQFDLR